MANINIEDALGSNKVWQHLIAGKQIDWHWTGFKTMAEWREMKAAEAQQPKHKQVWVRESPDEVELKVPKDQFEISFEDETETDVKVVVRRKKETKK